MKKIFIKGALMLGCVLPTFMANAQFSMSGEIRPRTEYGRGVKTVADSTSKEGLFTQQRSRLNFDYASETYKMKLVLQDVRIWGNQSQLVGNEANAASIHEAWGEANLSPKLSMKFGRQEIIYDDHRIFGSVAWAQQARSHDALLFQYKMDSTTTIHVGGAYNQDAFGYSTTLYTTPKNYKAMQYLWAHKDFSKNTGVSFLFLNNGKQPTKVNYFGQTIFKDNYSQTVGGRFSGKNLAKVEGLSLFVNGYYQMGNVGDWANTKMAASLIGVDLGYKVSEKIDVTLGFEQQSGQSQTDTTKAYNEVNHSFDPFYGTNHKFNGLMDYFYVGNHANNVGLRDIFFKLKYTQPSKFWVGADVHMFSAAADVLDINELINNGNIKAMSSGFGTEIDLTAGFKLAKDVDFKCGYSQMFATSTLAYIKGVTTIDSNGDIVGRTDQTNHWAWAMVTIKPVFINNAK